MKAFYTIPSIAIFATAMLSGCGSSPSKPAATDAKHDPVTIKVLVYDNWPLAQNFDKYVAGPVKAKYPYITVEKVTRDNTNITPDKLLASGSVPDIIVQASSQINVLVDLGLFTDMTDLMKKEQVSADKFDDIAIALAKQSNPNKQIIALPFFKNFTVLYYNKAIFDKFATPYPKDGMTWDEVTQLAKRVTRTEGGINYRGLEPNKIQLTAGQRGLAYVDPKTGKANVETEGWKSLMTLLQSIYSIPGNGGPVHDAQANDQFIKDRILAMFPSFNLNATFAQTKDFTEWDMASYPRVTKDKNTGTAYDSHMMLISSTSKDKEDAFKVIATIVSDPVATMEAEDGLSVPQKDKKYETSFGKNLEILKGKNVNAIFGSVSAMPVPPSDVSPQDANTVYAALTNDVLKDGKDIPTALRDSNDKINKLLDAAKK